MKFDPRQGFHLFYYYFSTPSLNQLIDQHFVLRNIEVVTPGPRGQTFITQLYFRDQVPPSYENYVRGRGSQFGRVAALGQEQSGLPNGGTQITFNITLDQ